MAKKKKRGINPQETFQGKDLLVGDLRELIELLNKGCTPEEFLDGLEEVYSEVVAMLVSSLPEEEQREALQEQVEILVAGIIEILALYKEGKDLEKPSAAEPEGSPPPVEGGQGAETSKTDE